MEYCGADESGFRINLLSPVGEPLKLRIHEVSDGLPGPASSRATRPRPTRRGTAM